jgi:hypothetical protein
LYLPLLENSKRFQEKATFTPLEYREDNAQESRTRTWQKWSLIDSIRPVEEEVVFITNIADQYMKPTGLDDPEYKNKFQKGLEYITKILPLEGSTDAIIKAPQIADKLDLKIAIDIVEALVKLREQRVKEIMTYISDVMSKTALASINKKSNHGYNKKGNLVFIKLLQDIYYLFSRY